MNIDATEDDLRAVAEVLKFAAILDDRAPFADKARIAAWAEKIHKHQLTRGDLVDGLQAYYDSPSERAIQIGDLIHHARIVRRDRTEREEAVEQAARLEVHDQRAVDEMRGVLGDVVMGPVKHRTDRLVRAELALQCVTGRREVMEAMREWTAAKREAQGKQAKEPGK